jgi:DNA-binding transcriptional LysR family regulator
MTPYLEPDHLRSFVAIAESGSFTEAAARVHRTQSAVSMQMRKLEEQLGRQLFTRAGRGIALSADGELLLGHARRLLQINRDVVAAFDAGALKGTVRIGAPDDHASSFLPRILARFASTHPGVEVELVCEPSSGLVRAVAAGELDLALVCEGSQEKGGRIVYRDQLVWVGSEAHATHELDPLPLALFHQGCLYRRGALDALADQGRRSRIAYTSVSMAGVCAAISSGLAIGVMMRGTWPRGLRALGTREGLPPLPETGIVLVRREAGGDPLLLDALEGHIEDSFASNPSLTIAA